MFLRKIKKLYEQHSVSVCGEKGSGKDMLTANIVVRRKKPYISNIDYGGLFNEYDYSKIDVGNTYKDFNAKTIKPYSFPYDDGTDIYLSDCGVYFPSQYCNELNKEYKSLPTFIALSRQLGECKVHQNAQALGRVWDKIREQSERYIHCRKCIYIKRLKLVIMNVTIYDKYESAVEKRRPLIISKPMFMNKEMRLRYRQQVEEYTCNHGKIENKWLVFFNKSTYDTRQFKKILKGEK